MGRISGYKRSTWYFIGALAAVCLTVNLVGTVPRSAEAGPPSDSGLQSPGAVRSCLLSVGCRDARTGAAQEIEPEPADVTAPSDTTSNTPEEVESPTTTSTEEPPSAEAPPIETGESTAPPPDQPADAAGSAPPAGLPAEILPPETSGGDVGALATPTSTPGGVTGGAGAGQNPDTGSGSGSGLNVGRGGGSSSGTGFAPSVPTIPTARPPCGRRIHPFCPQPRLPPPQP